jgi:uncharacterized protein (DUF433 family)
MTLLQDYFDFLAPDDIRIKGTRIGIESILYHYIHRGQSPEAIADQFHSVSLEQVYATILYYLHHREQVERYLADWLEFSRHAREEQERHPPPVVQRLRQFKSTRQTSAPDS